MIKYLLMKNRLLNDPSKCVAYVSSPVSKDLNDVITMMIAEGTGLTRPQAMAYFEKLTQTVIYFLEEGHSVITPLFKVRPTITGLFDSKEDNFDATRHQIQIRTSTGLRLRKLPAGIEVQKVEANSQIPIINTFIDAASEQKNAMATPESIGVILGNQLKFNTADMTQGVFFVSVTNPMTVVRAMVYSKVTPKEVHFNIPELEPGDYTIKVAAESNDKKSINTGYMKVVVTA